MHTLPVVPTTPSLEDMRVQPDIQLTEEEDAGIPTEGPRRSEPGELTNNEEAISR